MHGTGIKTTFLSLLFIYFHLFLQVACGLCHLKNLGENYKLYFRNVGTHVAEQVVS